MTDSRFGIGVIGTGLWGGHHLQVFDTLAQTAVIAVCDRDETRAREAASGIGTPAIYTDHRELLKDPAIDAVSIATPDFTHTQIILDALRAGKHVLSEKPLATTIAEAEAIQSAVKASDRIVMVDFHNRVNPLIAGARDDVQGGAIGRPVHVSARLSNTTFVPLEMLSWAAKSSALWFLGSHVVDALRFILNDEVVRVYAVSAKGVLRDRDVDTADFHLAILEFSGGTKATLENSWILSPDNPQVFDFRIEIVGDGGQIQIDSSHSGAFVKLDGSGMKYRDPFGLTPAGKGRTGGFVQESIARFVDALSGDPVLATVDDGLAVTRVLAAIEQSVGSRQPVDVTG